MCLYRVGFLDVVDQQAVVLRIFNRYLKLCRFLQKRYRMKPALTSQFAIDEFQFVPYIWGSAQLIGNPLNLEPESYANRATVKKFSKDYLLFDAVKFIFQIWRAPNTNGNDHKQLMF
ncbi:unnamed protein product [Nippostrongylus brasiliensis]|uniref:Serine/threonine-protein phosphatase 2A activator n=1 Tax=Nippostrongylus brasiliensis TaxID=27835 RepID=A0A0N4Y2G0_NIPBR|nr:unnamed protein product [Nippostrongylus brasiliensis]